jgi:hypothetical protein
MINKKNNILNKIYGTNNTLQNKLNICFNNNIIIGITIKYIYIYL